MKLHRFNDEGINRFCRFLDARSVDMPWQFPPIFLRTRPTQSPFPGPRSPCPGIRQPHGGRPLPG